MPSSSAWHSAPHSSRACRVRGRRSSAGYWSVLTGQLRRNIRFFLLSPRLSLPRCSQFGKSGAVFRSEDFLALGIGLLVSFLVAWIVIAAFLTFVKRHSLRPFAYYRI